MWRRVWGLHQINCHICFTSTFQTQLCFSKIPEMYSIRRTNSLTLNIFKLRICLFKSFSGETICNGPCWKGIMSTHTVWTCTIPSCRRQIFQTAHQLHKVWPKTGNLNLIFLLVCPSRKAYNWLYPLNTRYTAFILSIHLFVKWFHVLPPVMYFDLIASCQFKYYFKQTNLVRNLRLVLRSCAWCPLCCLLPLIQC